MIEILAENLKPVLDAEHLEGKLTYSGKTYEVWEVSDDTYQILANMKEEYFERRYPESMWRSAVGSNMKIPDTQVKINDLPITAWENHHNEDIENDGDEIYIDNDYEDLLTYFCDAVGASQPCNVCALAVDLAKYNNMKLSELFIRYEGDNTIDFLRN